MEPIQKGLRWGLWLHSSCLRGTQTRRPRRSLRLPGPTRPHQCMGTSYPPTPGTKLLQGMMPGHHPKGKGITRPPIVLQVKVGVDTPPETTRPLPALLWDPVRSTPWTSLLSAPEPTAPHLTPPQCNHLEATYPYPYHLHTSLGLPIPRPPKIHFPSPKS